MANNPLMPDGGPIDRIGPPPCPPRQSPEPDLAFGVLEALGDLCSILIAKGVIAAPELGAALRDRETVCRAQHGNIHALAAKTLAECCEIWVKTEGIGVPQGCAGDCVSEASTTTAYARRAGSGLATLLAICAASWDELLPG